MELLQANPHYAHVRYPDGRETTVAMKHLAPRGHMEVVETHPAPECIPEKAENLEVVETQPAPERIPEKAENLPLNTHVSVLHMIKQLSPLFAVTCNSGRLYLRS